MIRKIKDITGAGKTEIKKAEKGLYAILSRDAKKAEKALGEAHKQLEEMKAKRTKRFPIPQNSNKNEERKDSSVQEVQKEISPE